MGQTAMVCPSILGFVMILKDDNVELCYYTALDLPSENDALKSMIANSNSYLFIAEENSKIVTFSLPPRKKMCVKNKDA